MKAVAALLILVFVTTALAQQRPLLPPPSYVAKEIVLPHFMPHLPDGPGRELFAANCLACHSTRYITMQPIVTQPKWEENIRKMIKTYGAPIGEESVTPIAQYVMAMQKAEADPLTRAVSNPPPHAIDLSIAGDAQRGAKVYASACASCHGESGKGDGPAMKNLLPTATDLTRGTFARESVLRSITHGVPGTSMPAFPSLNDEQARDVVAFTLSLGEKTDAKPAMAADDVKKVFVTSCGGCHGDTGGGNGFNAPTLARAPTNFRERQPSLDHAIKVIEDGVAGTAMPAWKAKLDQPQRAKLAEYVRSLYVASAPVPAP